ncbi:M43 family zinc metalloprotease [Olleya sp. YS]|uniref:M43 family zinc metalloprotease n=1 Tax=Olleya sp. YS TaxID=3028318 RepID=UPI0024346237|nr:M43 family zinc metalloprotease [Olleya sp. YS]WGD35616.1 M43 family zinc metalloprotease [Olleya sp. YS]
MKKLFLSMAVVALLFSSCSDDKSEVINDDQSKVDMSDFYVYTDADVDETARQAQGKTVCHSMVNLNRLLNENPGLEKKMYDIEYDTRSFLANAKKPGKGNGNGGGPGGGGSGGGDPIDNLGVVNIPVYVHVVYSNSQENVSDQKINAQISVLNNDFRASNNDVNQVPSEFAGLVADTEINFTLAGTFRHANSTSAWSTNDAVKAAYPPVTPSTHLNIWVCNISGGILGYAQFPGGPSATDGVVVLYSSLPGGSAAPYNQGRTLTHEVGHYLNLRHIWGDGRCKQDDFVADTPSSDGPNYGCPSYPTVNCRSNDMTMNYMDYVNDDCMYMFSTGQKSRMRTIFQSGGSRAALVGN